MFAPYLVKAPLLVGLYQLLCIFSSFMINLALLCSTDNALEIFFFSNLFRCFSVFML